MNKIVSFLEAHVEKIVLMIVGLVCIWLMITRVIFSPNQVSYGDGKYSPAAIDEQVFEEAKLLRDKVNTPPEGPELYKSKLTEFLALLDSSINDIDVSIWPQMPYVVDETLRGTGGKYRLPRIGPVTEVAIEHIRAAAYVPTDVITPENQYDKAANEPNDIDLITVEAKFDIAGLYERFKQCFVDDVEKQYSDPCLAEPIFAAVQLQRQELGKDGSWSSWRSIPRTKIDHYGELFEIVEDAGSLPPGRLKVTKLQFDDWQLQTDLLQPEAYSMASAKEEWYPPLIHRKFLDIQKKEDAEEARKAREGQQTANDRSDSRRSRDSALGGTTGRTAGRAGGRVGGGGAGVGMENLYGGAGGGTSRRRDSSRGSSGGGRTGTQSYEGGGLAGSSDRRTRGRTGGRGDQTGALGGADDYMISGLPGDRPARRGPSMIDVYDDFDKIRLNAMTVLEKMKEPLVFWAHDDTVEPKKHYRYRIRLGVFNPVAGTNQLSEQDESRKNEVVLWSEFSDITEQVEIPGRMYFFAKHIREPADVVTVQVSKYVNGYWHSEDFKVSQGELIGSVVETEIEPQQRRGEFGRGIDPRLGAGRGMTDPRMSSISFGRPNEKSVVPDLIDYSTGAVMVDAVAVDDWAGDKNLTARRYYDMLYSMDGTDIEHMPVRTAYWAKDLQNWYGKISTSENVTKEPFKTFKSGRSARPGRLGGDEMGGYEDMYNYGEMYDDMGGGGRY
ncbi:MAG: hypothetical protein H8D56_10555 [Planctomycetes bacterium]|nr:hypothetical protein [Planctomycetota bacterium]MBL7146499.1 hypothetical protein [Phycisphaerae bacterium]